MVLKKIDFEGCVALLHIMSIPFGVGAISSSNLKSIASKIRNIIPGMCIISLLVLSYSSAYKMENETRARKLLILFKGYRTIGMILTILYSFYNNKDFRETVNKVQAMDRKLNSFEEPISYKLLTIFLVTIYIYSLFFTSLGFSLILSDTLEKPTWFILFRLFFECYQHTFSLLVLIYFDFFCIIFIFRFIKIKKMLRTIRDNAIKEENGHTPIQLLLAVSRTYDDIFYGIESFNKMISLPLLTLMVNNTLDSLVIITIIYSGEENKMDYLNLYAILMYFILTTLPAVVVTQMSEQFCDILGECNICYADQNMSFAKNTLLLQVCHQKINFSIYKIFPITVGTIVDVFTFGTTNVIFLFQLANTW